MKILILGFSVTADPSGFAPRVKSYLSRIPGLEIDICGIGGGNVLIMPPIFDQLSAKSGPYDFVFLELATSVYGSKQSNWSECLNLLYDLLSRVQSTGARIGLINLYRSDYEYQFHVFDMIIESIAMRYNLALLDKAMGLERDLGPEFCKSLLRDVVHTNVLGAMTQADWVSDFIQKSIVSIIPQHLLPLPKYQASFLTFSSNPKVHPKELFKYKRAGLELDCMILNEDESCSLLLPEEAIVYGISFCRHSLCGKIQLNYGHQTKNIDVMMYDQNSYYTHFGFQRIPHISNAIEITVTQSSETPTIQLTKGEKSIGKRFGLLHAIWLLKSK